jgi:hypothetical protein
VKRQRLAVSSSSKRHLTTNRIQSTQVRSSQASPSLRLRLRLCWGYLQRRRVVVSCSYTYLLLLLQDSQIQIWHQIAWGAHHLYWVVDVTYTPDVSYYSPHTHTLSPSVSPHTAGATAVYLHTGTETHTNKYLPGYWLHPYQRQTHIHRSFQQSKAPQRKAASESESESNLTLGILDTYFNNLPLTFHFFPVSISQTLFSSTSALLPPGAFPPDYTINRITAQSFITLHDPQSYLICSWSSTSILHSAN